MIAISESVRQNLAPHVDADCLHVVRHGVDDAYRVQEPTFAEPPFVLHVSIAAPRKNPEAVREVARRLEERVVIAGSGWDEHTPTAPSSRTSRCGGYVPEAELVELYKQAAVLYFPTLHEGFGLPLVEAMAAGTPVVASDVYSVPELVGSEEFLFEARDVDGQVEAVRGLLDDEARRRAEARRGIERAGEFTWVDAAERVRDVYRQMTD